MKYLRLFLTLIYLGSLTQTDLATETFKAVVLMTCAGLMCFDYFINDILPDGFNAHTLKKYRVETFGAVSIMSLALAHQHYKLGQAYGLFILQALIGLGVAVSYTLHVRAKTRTEKAAQ